MRGIYIHIPFCDAKCVYCDFLSFPGKHEAAKARYVSALINEMRLRLQDEWKRPETIFIGGGTPTALTPSDLYRLLEEIRRYIDFSSVQEFTVEANPGTVDEDKLALLRDGGVNRLSFGVQSFDDTLLKMLGRIHTAVQAKEAMWQAREAGFTNINLDLIYGLPGQTEKQWYQTLSQAIALAPEHLSLYQLIPEPGTALVRRLQNGHFPKIDEEGAAAWFEMQPAWLAKAGYRQYEISNYARVGYASKHNQIYWRLENYLGIGLGATSWQRPQRTVNIRKFQDYCTALESKQMPLVKIEHLSLAEEQSESVFMALRMNAGLSREEFRRLYGEDLTDVFADAIATGITRGWLLLDEKSLRLTDEGRRFGNFVFELFL